MHGGWAVSATEHLNTTKKQHFYLNPDRRYKWKAAAYDMYVLQSVIIQKMLVKSYTIKTWRRQIFIQLLINILQQQIQCSVRVKKDDVGLYAEPFVSEPRFCGIKVCCI